jgi:hypothetical protein
MPVSAALAGGKVALYHPFQAPAGGKVALTVSKVLYRPLQLLQRAVKCNCFGVDIFFAQNSRNYLNKSKFYAVSISKV